MSLSTMSREELEALSQEINARYEEFKGKNLALDLTRGKPSAPQLDLSNGLLTLPGEGSTKDEDGTDIRNYGNLAGLKSIRAIWAELLGVPVEEIISENNASLEIMHYVLTFAMLHGLPTSPQPWVKEETLKWICPVPGYDRHFAITETLGLSLIHI